MKKSRLRDASCNILKRSVRNFKLQILSNGMYLHSFAFDIGMVRQAQAIESCRDLVRFKSYRLKHPWFLLKVDKYKEQIKV